MFHGLEGVYLVGVAHDGIRLVVGGSGGVGGGFRTWLAEGQFCVVEGVFLEVDREELGFLIGDALDLFGRPAELLIAGEAEGKAAWGNIRLLDFLAS